MQVSEIRFRDVYLRFAFVRTKEFDNDENGVLVYGYISHEEGLKFKVLREGKISNTGQIEIFEEQVNVADYKYEDIKKYNIYLMDDKKGMSLEYEEEIEQIKNLYENNEGLTVVRRLSFLDESRDIENPDDIKIVVMKKGIEPEWAWVKVKNLTKEKKFSGELLSDIDKDYGVVLGDIVEFGYVEKNDKGVCVAMI